MKDNSIRSYKTQFKRGEVVASVVDNDWPCDQITLRSVIDKKRFIYTSKESLSFHIKDNAILPFKREI